MPTNNNIILGISPGTRLTGLVALNNTEIIDWKMINLCEAWSMKKLQKIIQIVERMIEKNEVSAISLKLNSSTRKTMGLTAVVLAIVELAEHMDIALYTYTTQDLAEDLLPETECTKRIMAEYLLLHYPELIPLYNKEQGRQNPYYMKLFEAIACARHSKNAPPELSE